MYQIEFSKPQSVYFMGIGGISMSGLAEVLMNAGFRVSGSDSVSSPLTKHLEEKGASVYYGQKAENIKDDIDVVVYTAAIRADNPELIEVKGRGLPLLTRAELLGQMMKNFKNAIAISGTHGKTSTTSMVAEIFLAAENDPTISVGGILSSIGGNIRVGGSEFFVTEACEYTNSFLSFYPTMAVVLNVEADHLDFFKDLDDIRNSFRLFVEKVPENGVIIINSMIEDFQEIITNASGRVVTFGLSKDSDYSAGDIMYDEYARPTFTLYRKGEAAGSITLGVEGEHSVYNALAAIAVAFESGVGLESIKKGLLNFSGTNRRFEKKGVLKGITIIDDYAHHPQEITATLKTAENYPHKRIWCVFQPHTYTRTKSLLPQFADALSLADCVVLAPIYAARETDTLGVSSEDIAALLEEKGVSTWTFSTFDEIENFILENCIQGDLLITMGAGDVVKIGEELLGF